MNLNKAGVTLIELVAVLAIVGMLSVLAIPSIQNMLENQQLNADAAKLALVLRSARQTAISAEKAQVVEFISATKRYRLNYDANYYFGDNVAYSAVIGFSPATPNGPPACIFLPSGAPSKGGTIAIANRQGKLKYIIINPVAGRVRVSDSPPSSWD